MEHIYIYSNLSNLIGYSNNHYIRRLAFNGSNRWLVNLGAREDSLNLILESCLGMNDLLVWYNLLSKLTCCEGEYLFLDWMDNQSIIKNKVTGKIKSRRWEDVYLSKIKNQD